MYHSTTFHLTLMRIQLRKVMWEKLENVWNCLTYQQHCLHNSRRNNSRDTCNMHSWRRFLIPTSYFPSMHTGASMALHSWQYMLQLRASNISVHHFVYLGQILLLWDIRRVFFVYFYVIENSDWGVLCRPRTPFYFKDSCLKDTVITHIGCDALFWRLRTTNTIPRRIQSTTRFNLVSKISSL